MLFFQAKDTTQAKKRETNEKMRQRVPRTFRELFTGQLGEPILEELRAMGAVSATEVQERAIGAILSGRSAIVVSPTGSGKTLAFAAPLVELARREGGEPLRENRPRALVVAPSRELVGQIAGETKRLAKACGKMRVEALVGGAGGKKKTQRDVEGQRVDVLVATPGVLLKMRAEGKLFTSDVRRVVFDEADTLFSKGFYEETEALMVPIWGMGEKRGEARQMVAVGATHARRGGETSEQDAALRDHCGQRHAQGARDTATGLDTSGERRQDAVFGTGAGAVCAEMAQVFGVCQHARLRAGSGAFLVREGIRGALVSSRRAAQHARCKLEPLSQC